MNWNHNFCKKGALKVPVLVGLKEGDRCWKPCRRVWPLSKTKCVSLEYKQKTNCTETLNSIQYFCKFITGKNGEKNSFIDSGERRMCSILLRKKVCLVSGVKKAINIYNWQLYLSWQTSWLALFTVSWQEPTLKKRLLKLFFVFLFIMILTCQKLRENLDFERMCHWCL